VQALGRAVRRRIVYAFSAWLYCSRPVPLLSLVSTVSGRVVRAVVPASGG